MGASDAVNGGLAELDWPLLRKELASHREIWINLIIDHGRSTTSFFRT